MEANECNSFRRRKINSNRNQFKCRLARYSPSVDRFVPKTVLSTILTRNNFLILNFLSWFPISSVLLLLSLLMPHPPTSFLTGFGRNRNQEHTHTHTQEYKSWRFLLTPIDLTLRTCRRPPIQPKERQEAATTCCRCNRRSHNRDPFFSPPP